MRFLRGSPGEGGAARLCGNLSIEAIKFGPIDELRAKYGAVCDVKGLPDSSITKPNLVIKAHQGAEKEGKRHA